MQRTSRSEKYQYKYHEATYSPEQWQLIDTLFTWEDYVLECRADVEYMLECDDLLQQEFWMIILTQGTEYQLRIAKLVYQGHTQTEIAKLLQTDQSAINRALQGNMDYICHKKYGGLATKISKHVRQSSKIQQLMREIHQLSPHSTRLPFYHALSHHCFDTYQVYHQWLYQELPSC